ncbi:MAG: hypothetical protein COW67_11635 [Flavobacteriales bacterium CG18_big_fil_WC_8_21_14_2_50_32_9]|nr:hypothetical protein [Flavobacteriales bacterium]PIQ14844.1 MAG: hypothetical protein COW67_11635 [Flavobacteriales bacterium CG18_big_fil_WC_8_21_14_2_50_32_9]PJC62362.1 MAG: hypothetical protein CO022_04920 [Flavobacteriales bacterium CG_4_9_14_0_2_um_filter_32_27]
MKNLKNIFLAFLTIVLPILASAQYCNTFHTKYCPPSDNGMYTLNGQSKSALFSKGQTSELNVIVYKGQDYRISLCFDQTLGSQITFKVYETKKVKVEKVIETKTMEDEYQKDENGELAVDEWGAYIPTGNQVEVVNKETITVVEKQKTLLYDNSQDGFATELEFSVETTRRLIFEVSIPGSASGSATKSKLMKSSDMGCVGILVEHMLTPIQGFKGTGF